jgi:hypothetical protein
MKCFICVLGSGLFFNHFQNIFILWVDTMIGSHHIDFCLLFSIELWCYFISGPSHLTNWWYEMSCSRKQFVCYTTLTKDMINKNKRDKCRVQNSWFSAGTYLVHIKDKSWAIAVSEDNLKKVRKISALLLFFHVSTNTSCWIQEGYNSIHPHEMITSANKFQLFYIETYHVSLNFWALQTKSEPST